jgi:4-carboxymuconolactone decarboxylase
VPNAAIWEIRAHYEWFAHKREALRAGLEPEVIDAIAERKAPQIHDVKGQAIYAYAVMLHENHVVSDEVHEAVVREFGERGVVELVGLLGYYTLVAMTLNAFEIGLPPGEVEELTP